MIIIRLFRFFMLKVLIIFNILGNIFESIKILLNILNQKKNYIPALFMIWRILKFSGEKKLLLFFSFYMVKISHLNEVSFQDWVKAYTLLSKALFLNELIDDSINILINLLDIFACIPLEDFKFLSEIYRQNNISLTNMFVNFDSSLKFFSKFHVYEKSRGVFLTLEKIRRKGDQKERIFFNDFYNYNLNKSEKTQKTPETNTSDCNSQDINIEFQKKNKSLYNSIITQRDSNPKRERSHDDPKNRNSLKGRKISKQRLKSSDSNLNNSKNNLNDKNISPISANKENAENSNSRNIKIIDPLTLNVDEVKKEQIQNEKKKEKKKSTKSEINIDDFSKLQKFIDDNIKNIEIPVDSPCR